MDNNIYRAVRLSYSWTSNIPLVHFVIQGKRRETNYCCVCTFPSLSSIKKNRSLTLQDKSGDTERKMWIKDRQINENHSKRNIKPQ